MKLTKCTACGNEISASAGACPKCGHPNPKANHLSGASVIGGLAMAGVAIWWFSAGGFEAQATTEMNRIETKVAADAVAQYEIAKRQGDPIQTCVQAGFVSAAYLQAKDESNYQVWKQTQKTDCRAAGINQ